MHVYCIDAENTSNKWGYLLKRVVPGDRILVFFSHNCKKISLSFLDAILSTGADLELVSCRTGANAMDFQLCTELGARIGKDPKAEYAIVSEDRGYDSVVQYWSGKGIAISRIPILSTAPARTKAHDRTKTGPSKSRKTGTAPKRDAGSHPVDTAVPAGRKNDGPAVRRTLPLAKCHAEWNAMFRRVHVPGGKVDKLLDVMDQAFDPRTPNPRLAAYNAILSAFGKRTGGALYKTVGPLIAEIARNGPVPDRPSAGRPT